MQTHSDQQAENKSKAMAPPVADTAEPLLFGLDDQREETRVQLKQQQIVEHAAAAEVQSYIPVQQKVSLQPPSLGIMHNGIPTLQGRFNGESGCCCSNCAPAGPPAQLKGMPVVQRVRFLTAAQELTLSNLIDRTIMALDDEGATGDVAYGPLYQCYNSFESGSPAGDAIQDVINATAGSGHAAVTELRRQAQEMLVTNNQNIRALNYPNAYSAAANQARDDFRAANAVLANTTWTCPGNGAGRAAHNAPWADITIDHIWPCASHWNNIGFDTDRATRVAWYSDDANHRYMCRGCNSALGSGGIQYRMDKGPNYDN